MAFAAHAPKLEQAPRIWWLIGLLCLTTTASYLSRVNISIVAPLLMKEFSISQIQMGRVFSAFLLGYSLFQIPSGYLADLIGARPVLATAALSWVAATVLMCAIGWAPLGFGMGAALMTILVARFLLGVAEAPTFPAAGHAVANWILPAQHGRANGFNIGAIGIGSAIAPALMTTTMVWWGWRTAMLISALPALVAGLLWLAAKEFRETPQAKIAPEVPVERKPIHWRSFTLLTISYSLEGYVAYIFVFWFYLYLVDVRHFTLFKSAALASLPWMLSIVSIPLGGLISDRLVTKWGLTWGRRAVPMFGFLGAGIFLSSGAAATNAWVAAVCLALSTALILSVEGPFWASMMEIAGGKSGTAGGIMNMGSNLGGLVSPALTPVLAASMGWENALHCASAVAIVAGLLWFFISPGEENESKSH